MLMNIFVIQFQNVAKQFESTISIGGEIQKQIHDCDNQGPDTSRKEQKV